MSGAEQPRHVPPVAVPNGSPTGDAALYRIPDGTIDSYAERAVNHLLVLVDLLTIPGDGTDQGRFLRVSQYAATCQALASDAASWRALVAKAVSVSGRLSLIDCASRLGITVPQLRALLQDADSILERYRR